MENRSYVCAAKTPRSLNWRDSYFMLAPLVCCASSTSRPKRGCQCLAMKGAFRRTCRHRYCVNNGTRAQTMLSTTANHVGTSRVCLRACLVRTPTRTSEYTYFERKNQVVFPHAPCQELVLSALLDPSRCDNGVRTHSVLLASNCTRFPGFYCTHRPLSSSVLGLPYRILNINHKTELLTGVLLQGLCCAIRQN